MAGYSATKGAHLNRLHRIEGQVRGIARMVEDDQYCIDVLTQIAAASRALQSVALELLADHMNHCFAADGELDQAARDAKLKEATDAITRLVRS
ncbi:transcriptional regulator (plasmid) [Cellulomonas sp. WB94]|uniref:metal-sensitive transcriptional regulator n=1 Tax=Cellulomonas sp. WB94 TaxID=2173174 RepID=UPI000D563E4A|nr:metal-sensitive transcriptional regulator [Cellulomonas sp. WB94]PVU81395.1 transcriptional regulator [Cellulomonas sp. WB94]